METPQKHIVTYTIPHWGHIRPLVHLSARLVKLRPLSVTVLTSTAYYRLLTTELSRSFDRGEEEYAKRIRVIAIHEIVALGTDEGDKAFEEAWVTLCEGRELVCVRTGTRFAPLPKPEAIILDAIAVDTFRSVRAISGVGIKIYTWYPGSTYAILHPFGPESLGGLGNIHVKAEDKARQTGRPYKDIVVELMFTPEDEKIIRVPGMLPMYAHEFFPQNWGSEFAKYEAPIAMMLSRIHETLEATDGAILFTAESYEPEAVAALKAWFAVSGRPAYVSGPLLPLASKEIANETEKKLSREATEIQDMLEATLKTAGENSLLYISFGSVFWPAEMPEKLWAFLDVIMELDIPFILSHASRFAVIPDSVSKKVRAYGKGILSAWTPQQLILEHPATGWFVAHGGHNGVTEAISTGVPLILWPFASDQPLNAVHITDQLQIGYELLEVRTGHGLKPIYRNGRKPVGTIDAVKAEAREVLAKAFGEDGAEKRSRLQIVRQAMNTEWEKGGLARRDMLTFLDSL